MSTHSFSPVTTSGRYPEGRPDHIIRPVQDIGDWRRGGGKGQSPARRQAAIADLLRSGRSATPVGGLLEEAVVAVASCLGAERAAVLVPTASNLVAKAEIGWPGGLIGAQTAAATDDQARYTLRTSDVVVADLRTERRFLVASQLVEELLVGSVSVVIGSPGQPYGVLAAYGNAPFSPDDVKFVQAIADVVTMAVDRVPNQEAEQPGRRRERLASVGQATAGVAHDFNNVISAIGLYAELLQRQPGLDDAGAEHLAVIRQQVEYGASLVWQLLDSAHGQAVESVEVDLTSFLAGLLPVVRRTAPADVIVSLEAGGGPYIVRSDPTRLQQVFMNLATNATHALGGGGAVDITVSHVGAPAGEKVARRTTAGSPWVRIDLTDSGSGMHPDVAARAFEPFFTTKPPGRGTGLGLAQVHALVSQLGGHVEIDTSVVRGTRVSVWLRAVGCRPTEERCEHARRTGHPAEGEHRGVSLGPRAPSSSIPDAVGVGVRGLR